MRHLTLAAVAAAVIAMPLGAVAALPAPIAKVAADPARADDAKLDARRKGPELLVFAEVKPGQKVYDLIPGAGYFTRLFSLAVGPTGKVYGVWPDEYDKVSPPQLRRPAQAGDQGALHQRAGMVQPAKAFAAPEPLDLVFTSQNYHDYPDKFMGPTDPAVLNKAVYAALKPGGLFVIVDHRGRPGTGIKETDTLHRIDIAAVKAQVTAAPGSSSRGRARCWRTPRTR